MFKRVERLVDWWIRTGAAQEEDREVLAYGADLALYTAASTGALLLTGLVWGRWWEAAVIIACFYLNQTNGGGFHAASHGKCFGTMWLGLCLCLLSFSVRLPRVAYAVCMAASLAALLAVPLVLHKNKAYLENRRAALVRKSRAILRIETACAAAILLLGSWTLWHAAACGLLASAASRLAAFALAKRTGRALN